jgi:hypothetical protein
MLRPVRDARRFLPVTAIAVMLAGCVTGGIPEQAFRLEESTVEVRNVQTRKLEAPSETAILAATVAVLQDMEFNIDRIEKPLGIISASKVSDADDAGEKRGLFFLDLLCAAGGGSGCDNMSTAKDEQKLILTMVVMPSLERSGEYSVRITMQRIIFDKEDRVKIMERITTPEIYQQAFDNLRQSLFLEVGER